MRTNHAYPNLFNQAQGRKMDMGRDVYCTVVAPRDISGGFSQDIYAGQICFIARSRMFDGYHAFRLNGYTTVARAQYIGGGTLRLSWMYPDVDDAITIGRDNVEHLGCVVGCSSNDHDPVLWAYSN